MKNNDMPRRKGFSFLSFFLGILLGILIVIGTIVGIVFYVLNGKIDDVLGTVGVENVDENGNYVYVNTDKDDGGAETLLDLVGRVVELSKDSEISVGKVETLLPVLGGLVDRLCETVGEYVEVDRDELVSTPFSQLGTWVQEQVMSIQPAALLGGVGMDGTLDNKIISLLLEGREASYVVNGSQKYPAYYDTYSVRGDSYVRGDGEALDSELESSLAEVNGEYRLYFFEFNGRNYVTDNTFAFTAPVARIVSGTLYTPSSEAKLSGNYYYNGSNKVTVTPITIRDFADGQFSMLDEVYVTDFLEEGSSDLAVKALGGISLGDVVNGRVNLDEALSGLTVADLIQNVSVTDAVTVSLAYNVSRVTAVTGHTYTHTGSYKSGNTRIDVCIETEAGNVKRIYYTDNGNETEVKSVSVMDLMDGLNIDDLISEFTISDFIDITPDDTIVAYLAYGIYSIDPVNRTAKVEVGGEELSCVIAVDQSNIITSVIAENGEQIYGTSINDITGSINTITDKLSISDIMDVSGNSLLEALGDRPISELPDAINELTVGDVFETEGNKILENFKDKTINELPDAINDLTVGDVVETEGNNLLTKLADYKISEIGDGINELELGDVVDPGENKLLQKLSDKKISELSTAIDDLELGDVVDPGENKLLQKLSDKKINELSTAIDDLELGDVVDPGENKLLQKLSDKKINELSSAIDDLVLGDVIDCEEGSMLYDLKDCKITEIESGVKSLKLGAVIGDTSESRLLDRLKDTAIEDLPSEVNELVVGDVMDIDEDTFLLSEFKDTKILDLPNAIGSASVNSLYASEIYAVKDSEGNIITPAERKLAQEYNSNYLYYELSDGKYVLVGGNGELALGDFEPDKYYTYGAPQGIWKTLLCQDGKEYAYTLENLDDMISNVASNISHSTLRDLVDLGILDLTEDQLDKQIYYYDSATQAFKPSDKIGDMELTVLITFVIDNVTSNPFAV